MSSFTRLKQLALCAVAFNSAVGISTAVGQELSSVPVLESVDPLDVPAPGIELWPTQNAGQAISRSGAVASKVVAPLRAVLSLRAERELVKVIITLNEPVLRPGTPLPRVLGDALTRLLVAQQAHDFAPEATAVGLSRIRSLSHFPIVFGEIAARDLAELAALPRVSAIEENLPLVALRTEGAALIRGNIVRDSLGARGSGVGVAVVDTGVDASHPELLGRVVIDGNFTDEPGGGTIDGHGHGTSVAGIIAGSQGGLAPAASLWAVKVLRSDRSGEQSWLITALNELYGARNSFGGLDLVNLSLATQSIASGAACDSLSPSFAPVFNAFRQAGIGMIVATGNDARKTGVSLPSCLSAATAIGAVYDANLGARLFPGVCLDATTEADQVTCYSNSAANLRAWAPSDCARTPTSGGRYEACFNGTSAAAPYATGVAAQLLSAFPRATYNEILNAMTQTGRPITDFANGITRPRIDARSAYDLLAAQFGGGGGGGTGPCQENLAGGTICLATARFELKVSWTNPNAGNAVQSVRLIRYSDTAAEGYFSNPSNLELLAKLLDGCALNSRHWVFLGGVTDQNVILDIRDTQTGATKRYENPRGLAFRTVADTQAFATCP